MRSKLLVFALLAVVGSCIGQYTPPAALVQPLYPKGLRVSIPDEQGIRLMAFHGKINEDFNGLEAGTMARDITKARDGRWTYEDKSIKLRSGDTIYYWIHVIYEGLGYNLLDQQYRVRDFYNPDGTLASPGETTTTTTAPTDPSCYRSSTVFNGKSPCRGELIFEDHFNGLDTNRWRRVEQFSTDQDAEFVVYQANDENVKVRDGQLELTPTLLEKRHGKQFVRTGNLVLKQCTGQAGTNQCSRTGWIHQILPPVVSGRMDTKGSFNFLFGRVEIRAKVPRGDWIYPLITLDPLDNAYGPGYESGQLRVASVVGNDILSSSSGDDLSGRLLRGGAVISKREYMRQNTMSKRVSARPWSDDYHVYELEWTPDRIVVRVDGAEYGNKERPGSGYGADILGEHVNRWNGKNAPFNQPFYLNLGVAVGGIMEFPDNSTSNGHLKPWGNSKVKAQLTFFEATDVWSRTWSDDAKSLKVDYVKVWAL